MSNIDIIRAWKDEDYRFDLSAAQRAQLPTNPAGLIELTDDDLDETAGGTTGWITLPICPTMYPNYCGTYTICPHPNPSWFFCLDVEA